MRRRAYLAGLGSVVLAGCLSPTGTETDRSPPEFDQSETPICAPGESTASTIEEPDGFGTITDHEFFRDDTGRYGVRGRYEGSYVEWIDATFFAGSRTVTETRHRIYGLGSDEVYDFVIVASEGDASEIDHYRLTIPTEGNSGIGPPTRDGLELLDEEWGIIGESGDEAVYGFVATVQNTGDERTTVYMRVKSYTDENVLVHTGYDSVRELDPAETHTFYFPYLGCDPDRVAETDVRYFRLRT